MKKLIIILILASLLGCKSDSKNIEERKAFWETQISQNIPVGTDIAVIERWAKNNSIEFFYIEPKKMYYSIVEVIQTGGFVCSQWNIYVEIYVDEKGKTTSHKVGGVGTCL